MKRFLPLSSILLVPFLVWIFPAHSPAESKADVAKGLLIRLNRKPQTDLRATFDLTGLAPADLERLSRSNLQLEQWQALFSVSVAGGTPEDDRNRPAMLGSYRIDKDAVRFEPRFPLTAGVRYRAVFYPSRLPGQTKESKPVVAGFEIPKPKQQLTTVVEQVYPTSSKLPENQLRFYLHFSAPMSRGDAYKHIRLLDSTGKTIESAFLELGEELWDPQRVRFTLLIDPGRIKRGLKPREDLGPVLEAGKTYTLAISSGWLDAQGNPLKAEYRKTFRTGPEEEKAIDPQTWKIVPPPANGTAALEVSFPRPLDHALLQRVLWVVDERGGKVPGTIKVAAEETRWLFTPDRPWTAGGYHLVADTALEDLAGNSINGPFEVDVLRPIPTKRETKTIQLPFSCK